LRSLAGRDAYATPRGRLRYPSETPTLPLRDAYATPQGRLRYPSGTPMRRTIKEPGSATSPPVQQLLLELIHSLPTQSGETKNRQGIANEAFQVLFGFELLLTG